MSKKGKYRGLTYKERFLKYVQIQNDCTCWNWIGPISISGYGRLGSQYAHRISYEIYFGEIPDGLQVCHTCDNRTCVNPDHLFLGTSHENHLDAIGKGKYKTGALSHNHIHKDRVSHGQNHYRARFNNKDILAIRELHKQGYSNSKLAMKFGVSYGTIYAIVTRRNWKHIEVQYA